MTEFDDAADCCLPPGFARQLRQSGITAQQLCEDEELRRFLRWVAQLVGQQIVDLEWRHGRNRQRSHPHGQSRVDGFVARAVNAEARLLHQARWDLQTILEAQLRRSQPTTEAPMPDLRARCEKRRLRASTAAELHLWEFLRAKRAQGVAASATNADLRTSVWQETHPVTQWPTCCLFSRCDAHLGFARAFRWPGGFPTSSRKIVKQQPAM